MNTNVKNVNTNGHLLAVTCDCTSPSGQPDSTAGEKFAPPIPPIPTITDRAARLLNVFDAIPLWK